MTDEYEEWAQRATVAQAKAAQAFERLLTLAEEQNSGQIRRVVGFLASTFNGQSFPFNLFELRALDIAISDDMLLCLDALRWGKADLYSLVPDGEKRVIRALEVWNVKWPESE